MPKKNNQEHEKALAGKKKHILDFLYHDAERIGSFLAQFDPVGHLKSIIQTKEMTSSSSKTASAGLNVTLPIFGGDISGDRSTKQEGVEGSQREYDPLWANALTLKDFLERNNLIEKDITQSAIGQFIMCHGELLIIDTGPLQRLYGKPALQSIAFRRARESAIPQADEETQIALDALENNPTQIQAHLHFEGHTLWSTLKPNGLVTPVTEITLKHGVAIDGKWSILGLKDGEPVADIAAVKQYLDKLRERYTSFNMTMEAIELNTRLRHGIGRPLSFYGITPLMIFRNIEERVVT